MTIVPDRLRAPNIRTETVTANGLHFEVDMCGEGDRLALCLHGFPEHSYAWRHQLPHLASLGYRAWAPNLRGYGNSDAPDGVEAYKLDTLVEDIAGLIDAAGAREVVIIAHDWGGVVAWTFAALSPRPVAKYVFCNIPHPNAMAKYGGIKQLLKSYYIFLFQLPKLPELALGRNGGGGVRRILKSTNNRPEMFTDEDLDVFARNAARPGRLTAMINYYRALLRYRPKNMAERRAAKKIQPPVMMIWGDDDIALTTEAARGSGSYCEDFRFELIEGGSHWIQQERPDEVNGFLTDFLGRAESPAGPPPAA